MGIVFRQAIKTSIVNAAGVALGAAAIVLTSRVLSKEQLGGARLLTNQGAVIQYFLLLGAAHTVFAFTQRFDEKDIRRKALLAIALLIPVISTLVFCLPYYLFKEAIITRFQLGDRPFMRAFYGWLPLLGLLFGILTVFEYYLSARFKVAAATFMREVLLRLCNLALLAAFYFRWLDFRQYIGGTVLVLLIPIVVLVIIASRTKEFGVSLRWRAFTKVDRSEMARYAWYHLLTGASLNMLPFIDSLLLAPLGGFDKVAVYTNAQFIANVMVFAYRAMGSAAIPDLNEAYIKGAKDKLGNLFKRSALNMQIAAAAMWLIIICNLRNVLIFFPAGYEAIVPLVLILSIGKMADMFSGLNSELLSISRHYRMNLYVTAGLVVMVIILNRIFIPVYGVYASAWISSVTVILINIIKAIFLYKKEGLQPLYSGSVKIIAATLLIWALNLALPATGSHPFIDTALRTSAIIFLFGIAVVALRPSPDVSEYLAQVKKNKRLF